MTLAPIVLFVFNRPSHTEQTLTALAVNELADQSTLYIYADGPKDNSSKEERIRIQSVRNIIRARQWCKKVVIIEKEMNAGLAISIIEGVTEIVDRYRKVIVLEDDLLTSKHFLPYMNNALSKYENCSNVMQVSGYLFPLRTPAHHESFFLPMSTSWGWATWQRAWRNFDINAEGFEELKSDSNLAHQFDLNGAYPYTDMLFQQMETNLIDSWAVRWWWTIFKNKSLTLFPDKTLIENIGFGPQATHTVNTAPYLTNKIDRNYFVDLFPMEIEASIPNFEKVVEYLKETFEQKNSENKNSFRKKIIAKVRSLFPR